MFPERNCNIRVASASSFLRAPQHARPFSAWAESHCDHLSSESVERWTEGNLCIDLLTAINLQDTRNHLSKKLAVHLFLVTSSILFVEKCEKLGSRTRVSGLYLLQRHISQCTDKECNVIFDISQVCGLIPQQL